MAKFDMDDRYEENFVAALGPYDGQGWLGL